MDTDIHELVSRIHQVDRRVVVAVTGGGASVAGWLLSVPGASRTVLEVAVPYASEALDGYHWYHAAEADFLRRAGYREAARAAYVRALALCENRAERAFLARRITEM